LKVNGFTDFLANYGVRKSSDDPVRQGLGLMGATKPDQWMPASGWARVVADLGLVKTVIPESDRENEQSRTRGAGVVLSAHLQETFQVETETERLTLTLEKKRGRFDGSEPHVRYCFLTAHSTALSGGEESDHSADAALGIGVGRQSV
jgi:hypothetical protein